MCQDLVIETEGPITVSYDEYAEDPREFSPRTVLHLEHSRYDWPQETGLGGPTDYDSTAEFEEALREAYPDHRIVPVFAYIHGMVAFSLSPYSDPWDSGQAGIALIPSDVTDAEAKGELDEYEAYVNGSVYRWTIETDEHYEGCGGYYSVEDALNDARAELAALETPA
jgi:hypothetical protein